jgi:hypothetical protein
LIGVITEIVNMSLGHFDFYPFAFENESNRGGFPKNLSDGLWKEYEDTTRLVIVHADRELP